MFLPAGPLYRIYVGSTAQVAGLPVVTEPVVPVVEGEPLLSLSRARIADSEID